jgi:hypothetical protein
MPYDPSACRGALPIDEFRAASNTDRSCRWRNVWLLGLGLGLLLPRAYLVFKARAALIDSDEAIVGLMARHILHGHVPVWLYGISYAGSIEAYSTAILFALFGATPLVLKIGPFCWFCGFLCVHYLLASAVADPVRARLSTLLVAVSPAFLTVWSLVVVGTYMSLLFLGTLALLLTIKVITAGASPLRLALLGFVMGLAWWTNLLAIAYIAPILLILVLELRMTLVSRSGGALALGFLIGSLPFWPYNLTHNFASLFIRGQIPHAKASLRMAVSGLFGRAVPILLGTRQAHGSSDFFPLGSVVALAVLLGGLVMALRRQLADLRVHASLDGRVLLLAVFGWTVFLFVASGFGYNADEPRYLIPLYSVLYIVLLLGFDRRQHQLALAGVLLAMNLAGTLHPSVTLVTPLNAESNVGLIAFLRSHHIRAAYAPYWTAYRLSFESKEEIICTPPTYDLVRYYPYLETVLADPAPAYIQLNAEKYGAFQNAVRPPSDYSLTRVGNFDVFLSPSAQQRDRD